MGVGGELGAVAGDELFWGVGRVCFVVEDLDFGGGAICSAVDEEAVDDAGEPCAVGIDGFDGLFIEDFDVLIWAEPRL